MPKNARAWLLDWPDQPLALAACEVVEILDAPEIHPAPFGPDWCRAMVVWRDRLLALALPAHLFESDTDARAKESFSAVIVAFQSKPLQPLQHAAIAVRSHPKQIDVSEGLDCEHPADCAFDSTAIRACFNFDGRTLIVPELNVLFGMRDAA